MHHTIKGAFNKVVYSFSQVMPIVGGKADEGECLPEFPSVVAQGHRGGLGAGAADWTPPLIRRNRQTLDELQARQFVHLLGRHFHLA